MTDQFAGFANVATKALALHRSGQRHEALGLAKEAESLASHLDPPQSHEVAHAFNSLGIIFFESGFTRSATSAYERSLAIAGRLEPPDEVLLANLHNNLGQADQRLGRLEKAQTELDQAVAITRRISPNTPELAFTLDNLASVLCEQGDLKKGEAMHREALGILELTRGPFDADVATVLGNLSNLYRLRRDYERAEAFRLRSLDAHERVSGLAGRGTVLDLGSLADLYRERGDDSDADILINILLSIGGDKPEPAHRNLAEMLARMAKNAWRDFRLDLSERLGNRVFELLKVIEGPNAPETLSTLHLLANVRRAKNDPDAAQEAYRRAYSEYQVLQMDKEALDVLVDLGKCYRDTGSYNVAEKLFRSAVDQLRRQPEPDRETLASVLGNLALVYYEADGYKEADAMLAEAVSEVQSGGMTYGELPWLLFNRAILKYHLGDYETAHHLYAEAKGLWTESLGKDHPWVATTAHNLALLYWAKGDTASAFASFSEAERLRDREIARILAVGSEHVRAAYAHNLVRDMHMTVTFCLGLHPLPTDIARFAAQMVLRRKGRVMDAIAHTLHQLHESVRPEDQVLVNRLQTVRQQITELLAPVLFTRRTGEERVRLKELHAEEERIETELSYRGALYRPGLEQVTLETIQQRLPTGSALIEMLRFSEFDPKRTGKKEPWRESRYVAVVITQADEPRWFDLGPALAIDKPCHQWRSLLRNPSSDEAARNELATILYQLLIAPMEEAVSRCRQLLISPDGELVLMPFGGLRPGDGPTLADRFLVSYLSSGRDLGRVGAAQEGARGVVVIAAPDFDAKIEATGTKLSPSNRFVDRGRYAPLPGTKEEGEEIRRLLEDVRFFTGAEANVGLLRDVRRPIILHIATHGIFMPWEDEDISRGMDFLPTPNGVLMIEQFSKVPLANPMFFSGLVLSGANSQSGGIITAQEIAGLDLHGTELVVLSACETGLGTVKPDREFTGLRRALSIAGAMTQVTSLWKVDDAATRVLMGHYYRLLLEGRGRAEALQTAQSRLAEDPEHPEWKHPVYWAAFVSAGAWGPIRGSLIPKTKEEA